MIKSRKSNKTTSRSCTACSNIRHGVKTRKSVPHTCGKSDKELLKFAKEFRTQNDLFENIYFATPNYFGSMTGSTFTTGSGGMFNAKIDTYTIKRYEKDDFENLIQLLTLWLEDENLKNSVKEMADTFEGKEFSEEDIDKFILSLSLIIDDEKVRNKFEETHQYWKNIKR